MQNFVDKLFGIQAQTMSLRSQRAELLAANLANTDTPNYKAKDIDFSSALKRATGSQLNQPVSIKTSSAGHIANISAGDSIDAIRYRIPSSASLDGNTVDGDFERSAFSENAIRYQVSVQTLSNRINGIIKVFKGE